MSFEKIWKYAFNQPGGMVQEYNELQHVFSLMGECKSYLEIGTAEGKSLYILSHAMPQGSEITYIDFGEAHTTPRRDDLLAKIPHKITPVIGDSNSWESWSKVVNQKFDAVMIDAGHDLFSVAVDACLYGRLATKYIFFHDVTIPDVNRVFEWYAQKMNVKNSYKIINSETFGYGIIEV